MSQGPKSSSSRVVSGLSWCLSWRLANELIQFAGGICLARILLPGDFGTMAMVVAVTACLMPLRTFSVQNALIHEGSFDEEIFSTSFWFCLLNSAVIGLGIFFGGPLLARLYGVPEVAGLCRIVAASFLLGGVVLCHQVLLIRVLDFRNHGMMETLGKCAYMGCAIWLARHGHGAWSLAWGQFAEGLAVLVLVLILVPRRVALRMNLPRLLGLLRYGCSMTGGVVATQWRDGVSSALVGGVSGPTPLGFFQKAVGSSTLAIRHLVWSITDVLFPWMAGLVPDSTETREKVAKVVRMVTLLTWPACVGMAVVADLFIVGIYGSRWSGAVGLLRILCFPAMLFAVQHQLITMLWALGKAGQVMRVNLAAMLISWTGVWIGLHVSGVFGATVGLALAATVQFLLLSGCLLSAVKMGAGTYIQALLPSGVMAAAMGLVVVAFRSWCLPPEHAVLSRLFTSVCVGVAVYALLVFIWRPAAVSDFARTVHMHLGDERTRRIPYLSSILRHLEAER